MKDFLLEYLVCPVCKKALDYKAREGELICKFDRLSYPVKNGVPVLLESEAHKIKQP